MYIIFLIIGIIVLVVTSIDPITNGNWILLIGYIITYFIGKRCDIFFAFNSLAAPYNYPCRYFFAYELPKIEGVATRLKDSDGLTVEMKETFFSD